MSETPASSSTAPLKHRKLRVPRAVEHVLVGLLAVSVALVLSKSLPLATVCLAGVIGLVLTPAATWLALAYFGVLLAFSNPINTTPIDLGVAKIYGTDFVCVLLGWAVVLRIWNGPKTLTFAGPRNREEWVLLCLLALYTVYGVASLGYGLFVEHFDVNDAFGDYRRFFFYTLALAAPVLLAFKPVHIERLKAAIWIACSLLVAIGLWRIVTGTPVREDVDSATQYVGVRMLEPDEITTVSLLLAYLALVFRSDTRIRVRAFVLLLALAALPLPLLSGYRIALFFVVATPLLALILYAWVRRERFGRMVRLGVGAGVGIALAIAVATTMFPRQFERMQRDMMVRMQTQEVQSSWRASTWSQALKEWQAAPIVGTGMGHRLVFPFRTSDGAYRYIDSSVHNMFLEVLYQGGLVAFVLLVALHGYFVWYVLKSLRQLASETQVLATALFAGYVTNMGGCLLQSPGIARYVYTYLIMGFLVVTVSVSLRKPEADSKSAERPVVA